MPQPKKEDWVKIEHHFSTRWNFPNCLGALDGKHVVIMAPNKSGSLFFNYKGTFSIVLLALVDADYKFTCVDIGSYESSCDRVADADEGCIAADEAFPLHVNLMRPYPRGQNLGCLLMKGFSTTGSAMQGELWRMHLAYWHNISEYFKESYASNLTMWTK